MRTATRNFFYTGTTSANDAAHLDIQRNGLITAVHFSCNVTGVADEQVVASLEFSSTIQSTTNDARGVISTACFGRDLSTSGAQQSGINCCDSGLALPVREGDRIYLHTSASGTTAYQIFVILHIAEK